MEQVAAVSGDARRALELCRKAAEIAEEEQASADVPSAAAATPCDAPTPTQPSTPPKSPGRQGGTVSTCQLSCRKTDWIRELRD